MKSEETSKTAAEIVSNSRWNVIGFMVSVLANFVTIPIAVAAVGLDEFGAAGLVLAIYAPFSVVGTVLGQALVLELAPRFVDRDHASFNRILSVVIVLAAAACLMVLALFWLIGEQILRLMTGPSQDWFVPIIICGLGWVAQQGCLIMQSLIMATRNFARLAVASSLGAVLAASTVVIASKLWPTASGFLIGTAVGYWLTFVALAVSVWGNLRGTVHFAPWNGADVRAMLRFGKWQGLAHLAGAAGNEADRYALGAMAPLPTVGQFNVARRLQDVVHMGVLRVTEVLFPHFSITATAPLETRLHFFLRASWICNMVAVVALAPLIPVANDLITLWVNEAAAQLGGPALRTLATAGVLGAGGVMYAYYVMSTGRSALLGKLNTLHAALLVPLTVLSIWALGPLGAGLGYLVANLLRLGVFASLSKADFAPRLGFAEIFSHCVAPLAAGLGASWLLWLLGGKAAAGWTSFGASYLLACIIVALMAILGTMTSQSGRRAVRETYVWIRRAVHRQKAGS